MALRKTNIRAEIGAFSCVAHYDPELREFRVNTLEAYMRDNDPGMYEYLFASYPMRWIEIAADEPFAL